VAGVAGGYDNEGGDDLGIYIYKGNLRGDRLACCGPR
jgi:hypothetical protein